MPRSFADSSIKWVAQLVVAFVLALVVPAVAGAQTFTAGDYASLATAITNANASGGTIVLTGNITLTGNLPAIGSANFGIVIEGNGHTISGNNQYPGLVLTQGGAGSPTNTTIQNLTIQNTVAIGGAGANGAGGGGGGAGLGGALFIGDLATATVSNVNLISNSAVGGAGGNGNAGVNGGNGGSPSPGFVGSGGTGGIGGTTPSSGTAGGPGAGGGGAGGGGGFIGGGAGGIGGGGGGSTDASTALGGGGGGAGGNSTNGAGGGGGAGLGGALFVQGAGVLQISGAFTVNGNSVSGGAGASGAGNGSGFGSGIFLAGFSTLNLSPAAGQTVTITDSVADESGSGGGGSGSIAMNGAGTLVLGGNNTYTGGTTLNSGTLSVSSSSNLGLATGTLWTSPGSVLQITGSSTFAQTVFMGGTLQMSVSSGRSVVWSGTLNNSEGPGSLQLTGGGTLTLTSANGYSLGTSVTGNSTLVIGDDAALGLSTSDISLGDASSGGALGINAPSFISARNINLGAGGGTINAMGSTDATLSGVLSGAGGLTANGTGTLTLSGANTYSGPTVVNAGVLRAGSATAFGSSTSLTVAAGAIADFNGFTQNLFSIGGAGTIALGTTTLTVGGDNSSSAFAGTLSGSGGLVKTGSGALTLSGNSTFAGGLALQGGTLSVASDASLGGAGAVAMSNGTTLGLASGGYGHSLLLAGTCSINVGPGQTATWNGQIANNGGAGALWVTGGGTLSLTNTSNSYSGGTVVTGNSTLNVGGDGVLGATGTGVTLGDATSTGTLTIGSSGTFSSAITLGAAGGTISAASGTNVTVSGPITGSGGLSVSGGGTLTLGGATTYIGGTFLNGGSIVGNTSSLHGSITTSGTLVFYQPDDGTFNGVISGSGGITKTGLGTLSLFGAQGYTGLTWVQAGTLALNNTSLAGSVVVDPGATLFGSGTIGGGLNLGGTLTIPGSGTQPAALSHTLSASSASPMAAAPTPSLSIGGNLTTTPGSTLNFTLASGSVAPLVVNGTATLNGTHVNVTVPNPDPARISSYLAISTTGGLQMTGGDITLAGGGLLPVLRPGPYSLLVTLLNLNAPLARAATSPNGIAVAQALDAGKAGMTGDFANVVTEVTALGDTAFDPALRALSGEVHATIFHLVDLDTLLFTDMARNELSDHEHETEGSPATGATPTVWFDAGGDHSNFNGGAFSGGIANVGGGGGGVDFRPMGNLTVGGGGALSLGGLSLGELSGSSNMTSPRGFAYAGFRVRKFHIHFGWSESHSSATTTRQVQFEALVPDADGNPTPLSGGVDRIATSTQDFTSRDFWGEVQYTRKWETYTLDAKLGMRFAHYERTSLDETGANSISLEGANDVLSTREWNTDVHYFRRSGSWRPNLQFSYRREFGDLNTVANMSFSGNPSAVFTAQGMPIPRDTFEGLFGMTMRSKMGLLWTLEYHFFKNSDESRNGLRCKVRL